MAKKIVGVFKTSNQAERISKRLVEEGFDSRFISVTGKEIVAAGNGYSIDTVQELRSDGETLGGKTGYLVSAEISLMPSSETNATNATVAPGLIGNTIAAGICADFVDLGIPKEDFSWYRAQLSSDKYLVSLKTDDDSIERGKQMMEEEHGIVRTY